MRATSGRLRRAPRPGGRVEPGGPEALRPALAALAGDSRGTARSAELRTEPPAGSGPARAADQEGLRLRRRCAPPAGRPTPIAPSPGRRAGFVRPAGSGRGSR
ncbi:hypothetical protein Sdia_08300 [Streptomyces diastaticus subsp. diastaticus]|uniref:Uncharacterized protein n=1 Tax=Streptomyces diastaticus subsp. diastaticus TaxID=68040 RepID=A0ABQ1CI45_STRDI|nr:hypothetical protein Sdia_08300 [Streptomyces diastaticus subsp. diastaticus]GGU47893.1 hypothetical protein GCM10015534_57950 [Streptomyces diastaticus subsp. diastaticus]